MASLLVQQKGKRAQVFEINRNNVLIGRGKDTQLLLPDISVSRHHCRVVQREDGYALKDLGSQNGTSVNGKVVQGECRLADGDKIQVGKFLLVFRNEAERQGEDPADTSKLGLYEVDARTSFLEKISSLRGDEAHSTTALSQTQMVRIRQGLHLKDSAVIVDAQDASKTWKPGEDGLEFGSPGIPVKSLGIGGSVVVTWTGSAHRITKQSGFFTKLLVNDQAAEAANLKSGDKIAVGKSRFVYKAG